MIRRVRTVAAAAVLAALASVVSACTSSSPTPGSASTVTAAPTNLADMKVHDILDAVQDAMLSASSYHVQGHMYMHTYAPVAATVDAEYTGGARRSTWTLETSPAQVVEAVMVAGHVYVNAPAAFWQTPPPFAPKFPTIDSQWVRWPVGVAGLDSWFFPDFPHIVLESAMNQKQQTSADGQPVLALTGVDGQLVVAAQGPPYPLHYISADNATDLSFSHYGKAVTIEAPTEFIEVADLR